MSVEENEHENTEKFISIGVLNRPVTAKANSAMEKCNFVFEYSKKLFGLSYEVIDEVIEYKELDKWQEATNHCIGTIIHRNEVLAIFNPYELCYGSTKYEPAQYIVIVRKENQSFGLIISKYHGLQPIDARFNTTQIEAIDEENGFPNEKTQILGGMLNYNGSALALLLPYKIFNLAELSIGTARSHNPRHGKFYSPIDQVAIDDFIAVCVGDAVIATPIGHVMEIVEGLEVMPVFGVDSCLRGLTNLRGKVIACLDFSSSMNLPQRALDDRSIFILLAANNTEFALCVDGVLGRRSIPTQIFETCEKLFSEQVRPIFTGIGQYDGKTYLRLNVEGVISWSVLASFRSDVSI